MAKQKRFYKQRNCSGISNHNEIPGTKIRISCDNTVSSESELKIKSFEIERFYIKQNNSKEYTEILAYLLQQEEKEIMFEYQQPSSLWQYFKKLVLVPMMRGNDWHIKTINKIININCTFKYYKELPSELSDGTDRRKFIYLLISK